VERSRNVVTSPRSAGVTGPIVADPIATFDASRKVTVSFTSSGEEP
jgi:hypothetical protein